MFNDLILMLHGRDTALFNTQINYIFDVDLNETFRVSRTLVCQGTLNVFLYMSDIHRKNESVTLQCDNPFPFLTPLSESV